MVAANGIFQDCPEQFVTSILAGLKYVKTHHRSARHHNERDAQGVLSTWHQVINPPSDDG
jgi:hypothetical protein